MYCRVYCRPGTRQKVNQATTHIDSLSACVIKTHDTDNITHTDHAVVLHLLPHTLRRSTHTQGSARGSQPIQPAGKLITSRPFLSAHTAAITLTGGQPSQTGMECRPDCISRAAAHNPAHDTHASVSLDSIGCTPQSAGYCMCCAAGNMATA